MFTCTSHVYKSPNHRFHVAHRLASAASALRSCIQRRVAVQLWFGFNMRIYCRADRSQHLLHNQHRSADINVPVNFHVKRSTVRIGPKGHCQNVCLFLESVSGQQNGLQSTDLTDRQTHIHAHRHTHTHACTPTRTHARPHRSKR